MIENQVETNREPGRCDHCGLPLPRPLWGSAEIRPEDGPAFCCLGCRLAAAVSNERGESGSAKRTLAGLGLSLFFTMNVMAFTMALWTPDVYESAGASTGMASTFEGLFRHLVMLFSIPVYFLLGRPLLENAIENMGRGIFSSDLLLSAGVIASFVYSSFSVFRGSGPVYFEVGCVVLMMVTLGRWLEATGKLKANDALDKLARLMPETVRVVDEGNAEESEILLGEVKPGNLLRVLAGERIPTDGVIKRGSAFVDEQVLTGESSPESRSPGDQVLGGTLNLDGDLLIEVGAAGSEGALARLIELVREARTAKGRTERIADQVSSWFFPIISVIALVTLVVTGLQVGWERGMLQSLAVVLIACPCALGLATPLAVWTALGKAAEHQVLFRSGEAVERLARVKAARFDKTGTLTTGEPLVAAFIPADPAEADLVLRCARMIAGASPHVYARAVSRFTADQPSEGAVDDVRSHAGRGVSAVRHLDGKAVPVLLGSRRLMEEQGASIDRDLDDASRSPGCSTRSLTWIAWGGRVRGLFAFDEELRPSAAEAVAECRSLGLDLEILTGDRLERGSALAAELGVPVRAGLLPEDKVEAVREARARFGSTCMVGDGVNDAPAMAAGDIGVSLSSGTDLSRDSAGVCLLGDDLTRLPWAVRLSRDTLSVIRWNLFWAFGYNAVGVGCAAVGLLNPAFAAFLMVGSSGFVILNSLRLGSKTSEAA